MRLLHDLNRTSLIAEKFWVNVANLVLFLNWWFIQQLIQSLVLNPCFFVACTKIENCLADQQLFLKGIIDPFLCLI